MHRKLFFISKLSGSIKLVLSFIVGRIFHQYVVNLVSLTAIDTPLLSLLSSTSYGIQ